MAPRLSLCWAGALRAGSPAATALVWAAAAMSAAHAAEARPEPPLLPPSVHSGGIIRFGHDIELGPGDSVDGPVVAFKASVSAAGEIAGPVVAAGGSVSLKPGSRVDGPAIAIGGRCAADPGADVSGPLIELPGALPALGWAGALTAWLAGLFGSFWALAKLVAGAGWAAFSLLLWVLFPKALEATRDSIVERPGLCALTGALLWPALGLTAAVFLFSILGIPLLPSLALLACAAWAWGMAALGFAVGARLSRGLWQAPAASVLAGTLLLRVIQALPMVGWISCLAVATLGVGAAAATRFGARRL